MTLLNDYIKSMDNIDRLKLETETKVNDLQYRLKLELELEQAKKQVENLEQMLNSWRD